MTAPVISIVGDISPGRDLDPPSRNPQNAIRAAEELGAELAKRGARLVVYGGQFLEADVVRGFVAANPSRDHSILMWFTNDQKPTPFAEQAARPKLFQERSERGPDWEIAFYRAITRADGIILMGGGYSTKISGQVAIGTRMPILALPEFGGAAARVWESLSAGEDLPTRDEIDLMARYWNADSAAACIDALFAQRERRAYAIGTPSPALAVLAGLLFLLALAIVPWMWGRNALAVWMLFIVPVIAGGAGAAIRPMVDRQRGSSGATPAVLATVVLGLVAGGIAGVLFVTAQLTADPNLTAGVELIPYARRSIPFALGVGFISGLSSDAVFGKLLGHDAVRLTGLAGASR